MEKNEKSAILVKRVLEGDSSAFEELYQTTYKSVFYHAQQILKNEQDVEDAVSEAYMRAYENLAKLQDPALFQAWVNRIVTNLSMNMLRDDRYRDAPSFDDEGFFYEPVAADADTPNMVLDRKGTEEIVGGMIEALPEVQRTTVILYYYDEMSVPEIAKAMDCSEGTVKSRLNYARKNLERAVLAEEKRGVKLYTVSPTLVFGAITLLIKSANIPLSSFMHISEILAGLTGAGIAAQASGAGAATAGSSAAASGTTVATAAETGASAGVKAAAAAKTATAAGTTAKAALATKVAAGILAVAVAAGGVVAATSSRTSNDEILKAYQEYVQSEEFIDEDEPVDPKDLRYALYDLDGDGTIELFCYGENPTKYGYSVANISGFQYNPESKTPEWFTGNGLVTSNCYPGYSIGMCQVGIDGNYYPGGYCDYSGSDGHMVTWHFNQGTEPEQQDQDPVYDYYFHYSHSRFYHFKKGNTELAEAELLEGTSLYRSTPGVQENTEAKFDLTDEEFDALIDNCVKIIGTGPVFDGQDLSMSYDEFMSMRKVKSAPQLGKISESSKDLAARRDESPSLPGQNAEALKAYQDFIQAENFDIAYFSQKPLDPANCRIAVSDADGDGVVDLSYQYKDQAGDGSEYYVFRSCRYDRISQKVWFLNPDPITVYDVPFPDASYGECQVNKNGRTYESYYVCNGTEMYCWTFSGIHSVETGSFDHYNFIFANYPSPSLAASDFGKIDGTSLYKTTHRDGSYYTEAEFDLTDAEFDTLINNCVKIIGSGPEFEGQDLSMSCEEFLALQSVDDAPQPGKPSQSAIDLAAEKAAERELRSSPAYQNAEALKEYQSYVQSDSFAKEISEKHFVQPEDCRYATYDIDSDGIVEFFYIYDREVLDSRTILCRIDGLQYSSRQRLKSCYGSRTSNFSFGVCQVVKNGKSYDGKYRAEKYTSGEYFPQWEFARYSDANSGQKYDCYFGFSSKQWANPDGTFHSEPVAGTKIFRSIPGDGYFTEPEFDLTDEEFYSLIDNCVKIIGYGPEFDGQDLSMSYEEFMALQSVDDAPQPSTNG